MSTRFEELFAQLAAPFEPHEVKSRSQGGRQLHYITARTAMNRLDNVLGPENWWDDYIPGENSVLCRLTIVIPETGTDPASWRTLTKTDAGGYAGMSDSGDDDKSGYSDSFKRAAVKFGIGRYLYRDGVPYYAADAAPQASHQDDRPRQDHAQPSAPRKQGGGSGGGVPRSGRALFAWTKEMEQKHNVGALKYLNEWGKREGFPGRMVDWTEEQVGRAHAAAVRKLQSAKGPSEPAYEEALAN